MSFESKIGHITSRNWGDLSRHWTGHIPDLDGPVFPLEENLADLPEVQQAVSKVDAKGYGEAEIPLLSQEVLLEAILMLHKASHVISIAERHAIEGTRTWSLSDAYQGAFFAQKAIMLMFGVCIVDIESKSFAFDVFPGPPKGQHAQRKRTPIESVPRVYIIRFHSRLDHLKAWRLFHRILTIVKVDVWDQTIVSKLMNIKPQEFSKQRNDLHYRNRVWTFGDLHEYQIDDMLTDTLAETDVDKLLDTDSSYFNLALAGILFCMGRRLLTSLSHIPLISSEIKLLHRSIDDGRRPLFSNLQ